MEPIGPVGNQLIVQTALAWSNQPWTLAEVEKLKAWLQTEKDLHQIAISLQRPLHAIKKKLAELGAQDPDKPDQRQSP